VEIVSAMELPLEAPVEQLALTAAVTGGTPPFEYEWSLVDLPGAAFPDAATVYVTVEDFVRVHLVVHDAQGDEASDTLDIEVEPPTPTTYIEVGSAPANLSPTSRFSLPVLAYDDDFVQHPILEVAPDVDRCEWDVYTDQEQMFEVTTDACASLILGPEDVELRPHVVIGAGMYSLEVTAFFADGSTSSTFGGFYVQP
jgi:hypothetical protein